MSSQPRHQPPATESETGRLEAFSDGVFAVAITLLALDLGVPSLEKTHGRGLAQALLDQWPHYLAYALSFVTILIMWINHHTIFKLVKRTDHLFLIMNGFLLMVITATPFATALLAEYIEQPDKKVAQLVYGGLSLLMAIAYNVMWRYASTGDRLLDANADRRLVASVTRAYRFGPIVYLVAVLLALGSAELSLAMCIALALFFALPTTVTRALAS
jgi:TMEM175 potassium channel family protein